MKVSLVSLAFSIVILFSAVNICVGADAAAGGGGTIKVTVHTEETGNNAANLQAALGAVSGGLNGALGAGLNSAAGLQGALNAGLNGAAGLSGALNAGVGAAANLVGGGAIADGGKVLEGRLRGIGPFDAEVDGDINKDMQVELDGLARFLGLRAGAGARAFGPESLAAIGANIGDFRAGVEVFDKDGVVSFVIGNDRFDIMGPKGMIFHAPAKPEAVSEKYLKKLFGR